MLQDAIGKQNVAHAIPSVQSACGSNGDHAARFDGQCGADSNDRGDLANAATQEGDWMCIDSADE
jgi:hypothetical protein